jgi:isovaleryl-CoA dehydrogenase
VIRRAPPGRYPGAAGAAPGVWSDPCNPANSCSHGPSQTRTMSDENRVGLAELARTATEIATTVVAENAEREDAEASWPEAAMRALAAAGLMGLNAPEDAGGHGQGLVGLLSISEIIARECASTALCYSMHCVGTAVIAAKATDHQKERYLEPIAAGEHITTLAVSEPGSGAHFWIPETRLDRRDDRFRIEGTKSFITNGGHADSYVISTAAINGDDELGEGTFSCVLVDADLPGMEWADVWKGLGMRGNSSRTLKLNGVEVPVENLLGAEGDQLWYIFEVVAPYFLTGMAGTYVGLAAGALEIAREHLKTRRHSHSGELLGSNPVLAHRLGELWIELHKTRSLVYEAARRQDAGDTEALPAIFAAKAAAGDAAVGIANEAMTLVGGMGYRENSKLARMLRDARASHVMSPTTDLLKTWVGRALLNLPLL